MKYIRLKAIIPLFIIAALAVVFGIILRDRILKKVIISTGQSIFEAKVEMDSFKTSLKNSSVEIKGLQIADKDNLFKNLVHIDSITFDMRFLPLLSKKVAIDKMSMENLRWQTERKTSGALPPKIKKKVEKKKKKQNEKEKDSLTSKLFASLNNKISSEVKALPVTQGLKDIDESIKSFDANKLVSGADLKSYSKIQSFHKDSVTKYTSYKSDINNLNIDKQVIDIKNLVNEAKSIQVKTIHDIANAQDVIKKLNVQKESVENTIAKVTTLQNEITTQFSDTKKMVSQIDDIIKDDYQNLLSKVKIPGVGESNISRAVFGPMWYDRVNKVMHYIRLVRKYMPPRKEEEKKAMFPRAKGIDVVFYKKEKLPGLSIKEISLSGTTGGEGKTAENPISVKGTINNISSNQKVYGRPVEADITGEKSSRTYKLNALFDHTNDVPFDTISVMLYNFAIGELNLSKSDFIPKFESGNYDIESQFTVKGDEISCSLFLQIKDIVFELSETSNDLKKILNEIFESIKIINLRAQLHGTFDNLNTKLDSNLDELISAKIKSIYSKKIQELQARIKSELNERIEKEKVKLLQEFNARKEELTAIISSKLTAVQEQKDSLINTVEKHKQDIESKKEEEKKKAEEKVKEKIDTELKKLFGK